MLKRNNKLIKLQKRNHSEFNSGGFIIYNLLLIIFTFSYAFLFFIM